MNKRIITTSAALLALAAVAPAAQAEDGLSVSGDIGSYSQYVWRGVPQTSGATAVQGDVVLAMGDASLTAWFSNAYTGASSNSGTATVDEFDYVGDYSGSVGGIGYSVGFIYYTYLYDSGSNFLEIYAGASLDEAPLAPSLTVYSTVGESGSKFYKNGDLWVDLGVSQTVGSYDLGLTLSYANLNSDKGTGGSGFKLATLSASKDVAAGDTTFTPSLTMTYPLVGNTKTIYGATADKQVIAGVSMGF
ncbi:MAG: hypothetical protein COX57_06980 [Alphaproteobacteria bacterium CG_4_10_14_0_2_um_filter_63_37]|nr:MAG: hypothetical protein AUJ55_06930 [Proteobacteria bacterium CG1_02_64_396]PJA24738.1 MAG: hypothetical protein COX57_06980 [Alphaproteobacteria bacterium CG_4_10_14_0_2_um_filter_63_37]